MDDNRRFKLIQKGETRTVEEINTVFGLTVMGSLVGGIIAGLLAYYFKFEFKM